MDWNWIGLFLQTWKARKSARFWFEQLDGIGLQGFSERKYLVKEVVDKKGFGPLSCSICFILVELTCHDSTYQGFSTGIVKECLYQVLGIFSPRVHQLWFKMYSKFGTSSLLIEQIWSQKLHRCNMASFDIATPAMCTLQSAGSISFINEWLHRNSGCWMWKNQRDREGVGNAYYKQFHHD